MLYTAKEIEAAGYTILKSVKAVEGMTVLSSFAYDHDLYQTFIKDEQKYLLCTFADASTLNMKVSVLPAMPHYVAHKLKIITDRQYRDLMNASHRLAGRAIND